MCIRDSIGTKPHTHPTAAPAPVAASTDTILIGTSTCVDLRSSSAPPPTARPGSAQVHGARRDCSIEIYSYDFTLEPRAVESFAARCHDLQTRVDSSFVRSIVCGRYDIEGLVVLRGAVLREIRRGVLSTRVIADGDDYVDVLATRFDLAPAGVEALWPGVYASHLAWVASQNSSQ